MTVLDRCERFVEGADALSNDKGQIPNVRWATVTGSMAEMERDIPAALRVITNHFQNEDHSDILAALGINNHGK